MKKLVKCEECGKKTFLFISSEDRVWDWFSGEYNPTLIPSWNEFQQQYRYTHGECCFRTAVKAAMGAVEKGPKGPERRAKMQRSWISPDQLAKTVCQAVVKAAEDSGDYDIWVDLHQAKSGGAAFELLLEGNKEGDAELVRANLGLLGRSFYMKGTDADDVIVAFRASLDGYWNEIIVPILFRQAFPEEG